MIGCRRHILLVTAAVFYGWAEYDTEDTAAPYFYFCLDGVLDRVWKF